MDQGVLRIVAVFGAALALTLACATDTRHLEDRSRGATRQADVGGAEGVRSRYLAWRREYGRSDGRVEVTLRFAKGISAEHLSGGRASIDLVAGTVEARVDGLRQPAELWLVDNRAAKGASTLPDPADVVVLAGRLVPADGAASLRAPLELPATFELDRVVVTREREGPRGGILLTGGSDAFLRLYGMERRGALGGRSLEDVLDETIARGQALFERETFAGNGRTCATCHPATNNFTIDPSFIATLPDDDPLFVAERVPELAGLENPRLMRERGLILENLDGFERPGVMRGVPVTLGLSTSIEGPQVPFDNTSNPAFGIVPPAQRTGWSGDGAPGSGSLREFAIGAVIQHFPRTLERVEGRDFRLPTDEELDALELFQLSLGRSEELDLAQLEFQSPVAQEGMRLFNRIDTAGGTLAAGKCTLCHNQAGANIDSAFFSTVLGVEVSGNANFGTGVNDLDALPAELVDPAGPPRDGGFARVPHDGVNCTPERGGFGTVTPPGGALPPGLCEEDFNTPPLIEAADTGPFFHNNAVDSLEAAIAFYNDDAFNESPGGQILASIDSGNVGIDLDTSEVSAIGSFLRVVNALENVREAEDLIGRVLAAECHGRPPLFARLVAEIHDAAEVLAAVRLHPDAVEHLEEAAEDARCASKAPFAFLTRHHLKSAREELRSAQGLMVVEAPALAQE